MVAQCTRCIANLSSPERHLILAAVALAAFLALPATAAEPYFAAELIFPLDREHNHAPGIVECPDRTLLVSWYRGSGERRADDVRLLGARRLANQSAWTSPFSLADTPGFPDCNTALFIDRKQRLWLFWPVILANTWESCITQFRVADHYNSPSPPVWSWQGIMPLIPDQFAAEMHRALDTRLRDGPPLPEASPAALAALRTRIDDKLSQRLGWQPRCKPLQLPSGRILLPLYSDTYSVSLIAYSDDDGDSWRASRPLAGFGNIQPTLLRRVDGAIVAYMRENGPLERIRVCESRDEGLTWGSVESLDLPNPGAGIDGVRLANGHWLLVYNDTTKGRQRLAVSVSDDEGRTWPHTRHLESHDHGQYHYPAVIQARDGHVHVVYSYFVEAGKSMKHAEFDEEWVRTRP
ncbi:MAG: sialidase family protein [Pirellulales bacterium]